MFKTKIFKIAYAITVAEGWIAGTAGTNYPNGSRSYRNHNPGNLRASVYEIGKDDNFSVFENDIVGIYAIVYQLTLYANGHSAVVKPTDTIGLAISKYSGTNIGTPNYDNYISIIEKFSGVSRNEQIKSILQN